MKIKTFLVLCLLAFSPLALAAPATCDCCCHEEASHPSPDHDAGMDHKKHMDMSRMHHATADHACKADCCESDCCKDMAKHHGMMAPDHDMPALAAIPHGMDTACHGDAAPAACQHACEDGDACQDCSDCAQCEEGATHHQTQASHGAKAGGCC